MALPSSSTGMALNSTPSGGMAKSAEVSPPSSSDFSKTNVQVEGVDKADMVKTDGKYIYTLSHHTISIVQALPASEMKVIARIPFDQNNGRYSNPTEFFINDENLAVFGSRNVETGLHPLYDEGMMGPQAYYPQYRSGTFIDIITWRTSLIPY